MTREEEIAFERGYMRAAATIIRLYDEPTIAHEVLKSYGKINWDIIDEYDKEILLKLIKSQ